MRSSILSALAVACLVGIPGTAVVAQTGGLPPGSYQQTCRNARTNGSQLIASCQKKDGHWRDTSIDNSTRAGGIVDDDGQLRCGRGGARGGGVGGAHPRSPAGGAPQRCVDHPG